jgi:ribonuclease HII
VAKVERDNLMKKLSIKYPEYGFDKNKGYATKDHLEAVRLNGLTPIHRKSWDLKDKL